jgi:putative mRNA 3-end processing factor
MVLTVRPEGIYCESGDFYIDPWRPVQRALITHAHSDHARPGHRAYLATAATVAVMRHRLGDIRAETIAYGAPRRIGEASISYHPAGHVPGSAQIRVEVAGQVWVVSGDYKTTPDGLSEPFEPVRCHGFITECTFGLPVFRWTPEAVLRAQINAWWQDCAAQGKVAILGAYALGKAQRLMAGVDPGIGPILTHGAVEATNAVLRDAGYALPGSVQVSADMDRKAQAGALVIAPPSALGSAWAKAFGPSSEAFASGWMALRGVRRRRGLAKGFIVSDHADWPGLLDAVKATGAEKVLATHGYTAVFSKYLSALGLDAGILQTEFTGEDTDPSEAVA